MINSKILNGVVGEMRMAAENSKEKPKGGQKKKMNQNKSNEAVRNLNGCGEGENPKQNDQEQLVRKTSRKRKLEEC